MAVDRQTAVAPAIANPAALGLGGFALTTFVLSTHNAGLAPDLTWVGLAFFYGGLAQFAAGMWEFRAGNTFGATAFSTYGAFWLALATFVVLVLAGKVPAADISNDEGWFVLSFAIFNTYMLFWSTRTNVSVFLVFLTLEITEIILFLGFFTASKRTIHPGRYDGILTAHAASSSAAAAVANASRDTSRPPVGS